MTKISEITAGAICLFIIGCIVVLGLYGCPRYNVYQQRKQGEAELQRANYNRQIQVAEGLAKKEASIYLAEAEVIRARGVDSAVRIIGAGLQNNPSYLRYLYIQELKETQNQVIYLPTEAGLPILEANRFKPQIQQQP
jgi:regulator of protease activity HflC (stomatin/prohibitin superfamily)